MRIPGQAILPTAFATLLFLPSNQTLANDPELVSSLKNKPPVSSSEVTCLADAIYFEARGESETGQKAVAQVIVNRAASGDYPASICGVVYQNQHRRNACQFSFACDGKPEVRSEATAWNRAKRIAKAVASGVDKPVAVLMATHYHATYVRPRWARKMTRLSTIGRHVFYRE
jgi:spore germination cell wall hydrolase CwlJ-like protein